MPNTPSTLEPLLHIGCFMAVIFAVHGVMKNIPISDFEYPVRFTARSLARRAASSMGGLKSSTFSIRFGKRTLISLTTAGHAEDITGFFLPECDSSALVASDTISAPFDTSNTSSKPSFLSAVST